MQIQRQLFKRVDSQSGGWIFFGVLLLGFA
jgi:hypothetical protein